MVNAKVDEHGLMNYLNLHHRAIRLLDMQMFSIISWYNGEIKILASNTAI